MTEKLGAILGWKFDDEPGIRTRNGEIAVWPASLGPEPNEAQIATYEAEYHATHPQWQDERREQYRRQIPIDQFIEAIFEKEAGRPEKFNQLVAKRAAIRAQIPQT